MTEPDDTDEPLSLDLRLASQVIRLKDVAGLLDGLREDPKVAEALATLDDVVGRLSELVYELNPEVWSADETEESE